MTIVLSLTAGFLVETALWLAVHAAVAWLITLALWTPSEQRRRVAAIVATTSILATSLAHRAGVGGWTFDVGRRDLPLLWSAPPVVLRSGILWR